VKIEKAFPQQILIVLTVLGALAAYPLARYGSREIIVAVVAGALLATANVMAGFLSIEYGFEKSYTTFLKVVLGGMGLRMLVVLLVMLALLMVFHLHAVAFTVSLLGCYLIFLVLEILYLQKKVMVKNRG
jgi:hypothetical protein